MYGGSSTDVESGDYFQESQFGEQAVRAGFVRKVYGILSCQLVVTVAIITLFLYVKPIREYSQDNVWLWAVMFVATFIIILVLACCEAVRRSFPINLIILGFFTVCEGILLGSVTSHYKTDGVLIAAAITAGVTLALTIFALQTKIDFTMCSGLLFVLLIVLLLFGLVCAIVRNNYATIAYASLGALVFSFYLVVDTQLMLGGKHRYSLSPEEYIFAALNLYLDIVNLFLYILTIVQGARN